MPVTSGSSSSTIPSTSIPSRSGAASSRACRTASSSVDEDARHDLQLPWRRSFATPSSIPSSSTLPPWDSMYGLTVSSACITRSSIGTG